MTILEVLESREAILMKDIAADKKWESDQINGRFFAGRVVIEEHWLEEIRRLIDLVKES
jgi:hypothetical protein